MIGSNLETFNDFPVFFWFFFWSVIDSKQQPSVVEAKRRNMQVKGAAFTKKGQDVANLNDKILFISGQSLNCPWFCFYLRRFLGIKLVYVARDISVYSILVFNLYFFPYFLARATQFGERKTWICCGHLFQTLRLFSKACTRDKICVLLEGQICCDKLCLISRSVFG